MPEIIHKKQDFFIQVGSERVFYRTNLIELHNGVMAYNSADRSLFSDESNRIKHQSAVIERSDATDVISVPKLNGCHLILIRSQNNPTLFAMSHINPEDNNAKAYEQLLQQFNLGETLDVIFYFQYSGDPSLFLSMAKRHNVTISSLRFIPCVFDVEPVFAPTDVLTLHNRQTTELNPSLEPKSIYFYYIPSDDTFLIYCDSYSRTHSSAVHCASKIFSNSSEPIQFYNLDTLMNKKHTSTMLSSAKGFTTYLPLFTQKFITDYPDSRRYEWEACLDEMTSNAEEKKAFCLLFGSDFIVTDSLRDKEELIIHTAQTQDLVRLIENITEQAAQATDLDLDLNPDLSDLMEKAVEQVAQTPSAAAFLSAPLRLMIEVIIERAQTLSATADSSLISSASIHTQAPL